MDEKLERQILEILSRDGPLSLEKVMARVCGEAGINLDFVKTFIGMLDAGKITGKKFHAVMMFDVARPDAWTGPEPEVDLADRISSIPKAWKDVVRNAIAEDGPRTINEIALKMSGGLSDKPRRKTNVAVTSLVASGEIEAFVGEDGVIRYRLSPTTFDED